MKYSLLDEAAKVIVNPNILVNLVSRRVKQLRNGAEPLVHSFETLSLEDIALKEIIEKKISADLSD